MVEATLAVIGIFEGLLEFSWKREFRTSSSLSSVQVSSSFSLSSVCPAEAKQPSTRDGSQKNSRSDNDGGDSIRFRRLFNHDTD